MTISKDFSQQINWWTKQYFRGKRSEFEKYLNWLGINIKELESLNDSSCVENSLINEFSSLSAWQTNDLIDSDSMPSLYGAEYLCDPFIKVFKRNFHAALEGTSNSHDAKINMVSVEAGIERFLSFRLVHILRSALLVESNLWRLSVTDTEGFCNDKIEVFSEEFRTTKKRKEFWKKYPVLYRLCTRVIAGSGQAAIDTVIRIILDWKKIVEFFNIDSTEELVSIEWGSGDSHRGGQVVAILNFSKAKLVYKPRSIKIEVAFGEFLKWYSGVQENSPPSVHLLLAMGDEYGYAEYIHHNAASSLKDIQDFYHKIGQLIFISWLLGIGDLHHENLIANQSNPYLVDVEVAFNKPIMNNRKNVSYELTVAKVFQSFLFGTGLLPIREKGVDGIVDLSGIGSISSQTTPNRRLHIDGYGKSDAHLVLKSAVIPEMNNSPKMDGTDLHPYDYLDEIIGGYIIAYEAILKNKNSLIMDNGPLKIFEKCQVRWVARRTQDYADIIENAVHPCVAVNAIECAICYLA